MTSPPKDVSNYGYRGKHLELTVPNLPVSDDGNFTGCADRKLESWVAAIVNGTRRRALRLHGLGYRVELWILDVEGTRDDRGGTVPGPPPEDLAEVRAILGSIRLGPPKMPRAKKRATRG
jgi:hypothetical protein